MTETLLHPTIAAGGVISLLGYAVVFFGLILLLLVVIALGRIMIAGAAKQKTAAPAASAGGASVKSAAAPAPGTAGKLKLYDVPDRDAAMIMAIVANRIGKPLNELRFRSIKEVK